MNKFNLLTLLFLISQLSVYAQYKPEDQFRPPILTESVVYENDDTTQPGVFSRYFFSNVTETGSIVNGKRNGSWYFFDYTGSMMFRGGYKDGYKNGLWEYFDKEGNLRCKIHFKGGLADSTWIGYSIYKFPIYVANYKLGGIIDTLKTFHESGMKYLEMVYRNGTPYTAIGQWDLYGTALDCSTFKFGSGTLMKYYPYGQPYSIESYSGGSLTGESKYLNLMGDKKAVGNNLDNVKTDVWKYINYNNEEVSFDATRQATQPFDCNMVYDSTNKSIFTPANYVGGEPWLKDYLLKNLIYPESAMTLKIEGTVWLNFEVDEIGHLHNIRFDTRIGEGCDEEAEFMVKNMPNWRPAMQMGIPVKSRVSLPIVYKLD